MKLKAKEIYNMYDAISALSKEKTAMPTAYYIAKNTKIIKEEASAIDEARQKLILEFAEKDENGEIISQESGMVKISDEKVALFSEELNKLFEVEIEVGMVKIPLSSLQSINIPINLVENLLPIIKDDIEEIEEAPQMCIPPLNETPGAEMTLGVNGEVLEIK